MSGASLASNAPMPPLAAAPDFDDLVRAAATYHGLLPTLVVKDYWVTRVLRALAGDPALADRVVFKGGTSLSKGWHLIDRFSEDIDLLLTGSDFGPMPGSRGARERQFKEVRARIEGDTPLRLPDQATLSREAWTFYYLRGDTHCNLRYPLPGRQVTPRGPSADWLLVEAGYRGGVHPHARRTLSSLVAEFVATQPAARAELVAYAADLAQFEMDLLKPERTFAEKLLALREHGRWRRGSAARARPTLPRRRPALRQERGRARQHRERRIPKLAARGRHRQQHALGDCD